jgi:hypothetical protein
MSKTRPTRSPADAQSANQAELDRWELDVPLNLLCEMAWRVGGYDKLQRKDIDQEEWSENVVRAYRLITIVPEAVWLEQCQQALREEEHGEFIKRWFRRMTAKEILSERVTFKRGCVLLNRASDPKEKRSVKKFKNAYYSGVLHTSKSMQKFEKEGFSLEELQMFDKTLSDAPKSATRDKPVKKAPAVKKVRKK